MSDGVLTFELVSGDSRVWIAVEFALEPQPDVHLEADIALGDE